MTKHIHTETGLSDRTRNILRRRGIEIKKDSIKIKLEAGELDYKKKYDCDPQGRKYEFGPRKIYELGLKSFEELVEWSGANIKTPVEKANRCPICGRVIRATGKIPRSATGPRPAPTSKKPQILK